MAGTETEVELTDDLAIETGFNDAIDDLRKSLGQEEEGETSAEDLAKAKSEDKSKKSEEKAEENEEEEEEEEEEMSYKKSIEDSLNEEPEAAAAMDVEPFLLQFAKAIDEALGQLQKSVNTRMAGVEKLVKSIGTMTLKAAELQKSTNETMTKIGNEAVPSGSLRRLEKARFAGESGVTEIDAREVLSKSLDWVKEKKIDLVESGMIEGRINKGLLFKAKDALDQKVVKLMREAS